MSRTVNWQAGFLLGKETRRPRDSKVNTESTETGGGNVSSALCRPRLRGNKLCLYP